MVENTDSESYFTGFGGKTVLHDLILANHQEGIKTLLQKLKIEGRDSLDDSSPNMEINAFDQILNIEYLNLPLIYAIDENNLSTAIILLENGAKVNAKAKDETGQSISILEYVLRTSKILVIGGSRRSTLTICKPHFVKND